MSNATVIIQAACEMVARHGRGAAGQAHARAEMLKDDPRAAAWWEIVESTIEMVYQDMDACGPDAMPGIVSGEHPRAAEDKPLLARKRIHEAFVFPDLYQGIIEKSRLDLFAPPRSHGRGRRGSRYA